MRPPKQLTVQRYCLCGASYHGSGLPATAVEGIAAIFDQLHTGEGHGAATRERAARARRAERDRDERAYQRELAEEGRK